MSLRFLDNISRNVVTRLTLWYSSVFILSFLLLFGIAYYYIYSSIKYLERRDIQVEHRELTIKHEGGGLPALKEELEFEHKVAGTNFFFVRLINPKNDIVFLNIPDQSTELDFKELEDIITSENKQWIHLSGIRDLHDWDILSSFLSNGFLLQVGKSTETQLSFLNRFRWIFLAVMGFVITIGIAVGAILANRAVRPARTLNNTLKSILENSDIRARVPIEKTGDEFDGLAAMFNTMLDKNELLITSLRSSLENIAHDIRTPVTRLMGTAELALDSKHDPQSTREALDECIKESQQIITILNALMEISAAESGAIELKIEKTNLSALLKEVVDLYDFIAEGKNITIKTNLPEILTAGIDRNKMRQALSNLVDNSIKYTPKDGSVEIEAYERANEVCVKISDTGVGIDPEEIDRIWERLYRGDKSRSQKGLGLGLSIVKPIIEAHKGHIEVSSQPGRGSIFTIHLPK
ncbi:MAG: two-component sensor histidine kinase [Thermodesulfobacteriota bacterium]|nr:MAG: two-component sensor histidine kinase [Thermodesulfobacteriota bacterium]